LIVTLTPRLHTQLYDDDADVEKEEKEEGAVPTPPALREVVVKACPVEHEVGVRRFVCVFFCFG
jgi:hypothetical protein